MFSSWQNKNSPAKANFCSCRLEAARAVRLLELAHAIAALEGRGAGRIRVERELRDRSAAFGTLDVHGRDVDDLARGLGKAAAHVVVSHRHF